MTHLTSCDLKGPSRRLLSVTPLFNSMPSFKKPPPSTPLNLGVRRVLSRTNSTQDRSPLPTQGYLESERTQDVQHRERGIRRSDRDTHDLGRRILVTQIYSTHGFTKSLEEGHAEGRRKTRGRTLIREIIEICIKDQESRLKEETKNRERHLRSL